eukprot:TRINITY_DN10709_c0_g1_i1.p1 TRINITY_DN10709_c0_g1~~TRINITY_DN10709_c0_g1_i1.p1  ORF type:complete len:194 (+),score=43.26 TRINITY_DN10709_c0_g1_i1:157-738(+)
MDDHGGDGGDGTRNSGGENSFAGRGPRPRGRGGWGFEGDSGPGPPARSQDPPSPSSVGAQRNSHFDRDDDDVPTIPNIEDEAEEDITRQVAAPPTAGGSSFAQPVRSVRELDVAMSGRVPQLPASPEEGVDLAPLMHCLCSERQVFEPDVTWDHELIFQEVASAINSDMLAAEENAEESKEDRPPNGPSSANP